MMRWLRLAHMHATRRLGMQRALRHMLLQHLSAAWYALRTNAATMGHIERTLRTFFKPPFSDLFFHWRASARALRDSLTAARRALNLLRGRAEASALAQWVDMHRADARRRTEAGAKMARVIRRLLLARVGSALRLWVAQWRKMRLLERVLSAASGTVAAHVDARTLRLTVHRWRWVAALSTQSKPLLRAALRHRAAVLAHAFGLLCTHAAGRALAARAVRRLANIKLVPPYNQWRAACEARHAALTRLRQSSTQWRSAELSAGFEAILRASVVSLEWRRTISVALKRMMRLGLVRAYNRWAPFARHAQRLRATLHRIRLGSSLRALNQWRSETLERAEAERLRLWTAQRFAGDPRVFALAQWRVRATALRAMRARVAAMHPESQLVLHAFCCWRTTSVEMARVHRLLARALSPHARLYACWAAFSREQRAKLDAMKAVARRLIFTGLGRALSKWAEFGAQGKAVGLVARRVLFAQVLRALRSWREHTVQWQRIKTLAFRVLGTSAAVAMARWRSASEQWHYAHSLAARLVHSGASRALRQWRDVACTRVDALRTLRRVAAKLVHAEAAFAWVHWARAARAASATHGVLMRASRFLLSSDLARGFRTMAITATQKMLQKMALARSVQRWSKPAMLYAWDCWQTRRASRAQVRRACRALLTTALRRAFNTMASYCDGQAAAMRRVRSVAAFLRGDGLARAWLSWTWNAAQLAADGRRRREALAFLCADGLGRAFTTWCYNARAAADQVMYLRAGLSAFTGGELRKVLNTWSGYAQAIAWERSGQRRAIAHLLNDGRAKAFATWLAMAVESRTAATRRRRSLAYFFNDGLARAMTSWIEMSRARLMALRKLRRAAYALVAAELLGGLVQWCSTLRKRGSPQKCAATALRAMLRWQAGTLARALGQLHELAEWRTSVRRIVQAWVQRSVYRAFGAWMYAARVASGRTRRLQYALRGWLLQGLALGFRTLYLHAAERAAALAKARHVLLRLRHAAAARAFITWHATAVEIQTRRALLGSLFLRRGERRALLAWCDAAAKRRHTMASARRVADCCLRRGLGVSLERWRAACDAREKSVHVQAATVRAALLFASMSELRRGWIALLPDAQLKDVIAGHRRLRLGSLLLRKALVTWHRHSYQLALEQRVHDARLRRGAGHQHGGMAGVSLAVWRGARWALVLWRRTVLNMMLSAASLGCAGDHYALIRCRWAWRRWRFHNMLDAREYELVFTIVKLLKRWKDHAEHDKHSRFFCEYAADMHREKALYRPLRWWRYKSIVRSSKQEEEFARKHVRFAPSPSDDLLERMD